MKKKRMRKKESQYSQLLYTGVDSDVLLFLLSDDCRSKNNNNMRNRPVIQICHRVCFIGCVGLSFQPHLFSGGGSNIAFHC